MEGWRFVFLSVGILSVIIGIATFIFGHDPRFEDDTALARVYSQGFLLDHVACKSCMHPAPCTVPHVISSLVCRRNVALGSWPTFLSAACFLSIEAFHT